MNVNGTCYVIYAPNGPMKKPYGYLQMHSPVEKVLDSGWGDGWWSEQFNLWGFDSNGNALWIQGVLQGMDYTKLWWVFDSKHSNDPAAPTLGETVEAQFTYDALRSLDCLHEFWFDPADQTLHFALWENGHGTKIWEPAPIKTTMVKPITADLGFWGYGTGGSPMNPSVPSVAEFTGLEAGLFLAQDKDLLLPVKSLLYTYNVIPAPVFPVINGLTFLPTGEGSNTVYDLFAQGSANISARIRSPDVV